MASKASDICPLLPCRDASVFDAAPSLSVPTFSFHCPFVRKTDDIIPSPSPLKKAWVRARGHGPWSPAPRVASIFSDIWAGCTPPEPDIFKPEASAPRDYLPHLHSLEGLPLLTWVFRRSITFPSSQGKPENPTTKENGGEWGMVGLPEITVTTALVKSDPGHGRVISHPQLAGPHLENSVVRIPQCPGILESCPQHQLQARGRAC